MTLILGEVDVARGAHTGLARVPQISWSGSYSVGQRRPANPAGDTRSATYPVDDVHHARVT